MLTARTGHSRGMRGFSMIEMLVGVVVGLFLLSGAVRFFTDYLNDNRRLLLETRIMQDLRTVADLMARDLRRAGYWANSLAGVSAPSVVNPYSSVTPTGTAAATTVTYGYSRDAAENNTLDANESFGFRLNGGVVEAFNDASTPKWQQLTDPRVMTVTTMDVTPVRRCVSLSSSCTTTGLADACTTAGAAYPKLWVRQYQINLVARAFADAAVVRRIVESVRVRNDEFQNVNGCPP